jgi:F-type H+-transporting ATPase subunit a
MEIAVIYNGNEFIIPNTTISAIIIAIFLIIVAVIVSLKIKKAKAEEAPSGFLNVIELLVETMDNMVKSNMGEKNMSFSPFILTLMVFIAACNLSGLFGLTPPTSDFGFIFMVALIVFIIAQINHMKSIGIPKYLKGFTEPYALMTPLNIISELSNPISMSFRVFGNILSGGLVTTLLYTALGNFSPLIAPLHIYLDIFVGLLQAFVFVMLTMVSINTGEN